MLKKSIILLAAELVFSCVLVFVSWNLLSHYFRSEDLFTFSSGINYSGVFETALLYLPLLFAVLGDLKGREIFVKTGFLTAGAGLLIFLIPDPGDVVIYTGIIITALGLSAIIPNIISLYIDSIGDFENHIKYIILVIFCGLYHIGNTLNYLTINPIDKDSIYNGILVLGPVLIFTGIILFILLKKSEKPDTADQTINHERPDLIIMLPSLVILQSMASISVRFFEIDHFHQHGISVISFILNYLPLAAILLFVLLYLLDPDYFITSMDQFVKKIVLITSIVSSLIYFLATLFSEYTSQSYTFGQFITASSQISSLLIFPAIYLLISSALTTKHKTLGIVVILTAQRVPSKYFMFFFYSELNFIIPVFCGIGIIILGILIYRSKPILD